MIYLYVFLGGGLGASTRFVIATWLNQKGWKVGATVLPFGTMFVNVLGSFIIAWALASLTDKEIPFQHWKPLLVTGFLGGFTTFSSFSYETLNLFQTQGFLAGLLNILGNFILCLVFVYLGYLLGK